MSAELKEILDRSESETVEFKGPRASTSEIARDVCAMLNQRGGTIVWGVSDRGKPAGLRNAELKARELSDYLVAHVHPGPLLSVAVEVEAGRPLVVVEVPRGSDKPYSVNREIWIRIASETLRATPSTSAELVERSAVKLQRWEREPMPGFGLADCDEGELHKTRVDAWRTGRLGASSPETDEELLRHLHLFSGGQLTNASVVLFARQPRDWAPNLSLRITSFADNDRQTIAADTMLDGPAVDIVHEAIALIQQRTGVSSRLKLSDPVRQQRAAYALFALREGLVNAVVHRDYAALGGVLVEVFPESIVIRNPGALPAGWTAEDLRHEHLSAPVNPDIARVFFLRGLMEQLGTGTQRLIRESKALGAKTPRWEASRGVVTLEIFRAPTFALLSTRQSDFVRRARPESDFKLHDYARAARVSERQARRDLKEMEDAGVVVRHGRGPSTSYRLRAEKGNIGVSGRDAQLSVVRPTKR